MPGFFGFANNNSFSIEDRKNNLWKADGLLSIINMHNSDTNKFPNTETYFTGAIGGEIYGCN